MGKGNGPEDGGNPGESTTPTPLSTRMRQGAPPLI